MPLQNRCDPFSALHAVPQRGTLMGNRGILHDDARQIRRNHGHQNWVTCVLHFKGRKRPLMAPHRYTELFFLDEATAFAAGHRPCAECQRARYSSFTTAWVRVHGEPPPGAALSKSIDRTLHAARIHRRRQITHRAAPTLPDGTFIALGQQPILIWQGQPYDWSFSGYTPHPAPLPAQVDVLTPRPIVALFEAGWRPLVELPGQMGQA